jgi:hypothetical protein
MFQIRGIMTRIRILRSVTDEFGTDSGSGLYFVRVQYGLVLL